MRQAMASLSRNLVALLICTYLVACNGSYTAFESDKDFDVDPKTADITKENAELITLSALQSAFYGHYQSTAYDFLDASDLPINCTGGGSVLYTNTQSEGEEHNVGDRISVTYNDCTINSTTYSGAIDGKYTKIKGLNNRFIDMTTEQCLPRVQKELGGTFSNANFITYNKEIGQYFLNGNNPFPFPKGSEIFLTDSHSVHYLPGDELRFERVGNWLKIDLLHVDFIDETDDGVDNKERSASVEFSFYVEEDQKAIFILEPLNSNISMVTSIDGDQFYTVEELNSTLRKCQEFERTLSLTFNNLSTEKQGFLKTILNGSVTLVEAQESSNRMNQSFIDSDFTTTVEQGSSVQHYSMDSYNVTKEVNLANNSYAYSFQGFISNSDVFGGKIALTTLGKLYGSFDGDFPSSGIFEVRAQGLEQINAEPDNNKLQIKVDFNGDSTGNGFADIDATIDTTWLDLFERNFIE